MNVGQKLVELSRVSTASALEHILAITQFSGGGSGYIPVTALPQQPKIVVTPNNINEVIGLIPTAAGGVVTPVVVDSTIEIPVVINAATEIIDAVII